VSDLGWLWDNRTYYDRRQNERIETLSSELSAQRFEAGRLQARLRQVHGDLQVRLNGLATAFDAFVELCDLREELRAFQPVSDARNRARRIVGRLIASGPSADLPVLPPAVDPSPELADYWLPHAVAALVAIAQGDRAAADAARAEARARDATRADLFLCLALAVSERIAPAVDLLPGILDLDPDRPVTQAQRELWLTAASGRLGDQGRDAVVARLAALTAGLPDDVLATQAAAWPDVVAAIGRDVGRVSGIPVSALDLSGLVAPLRAARQIDSLTVWFPAAADPAPADRPGRPDGGLPADPLYALLRELVDEGVADEQPLLARMVELRRIIEADGGAPGAAPPPWDAPLDTPLALLLADAGGDDAGRRAVAARAATPILAAAAAELVVAASRPPVDRIDVHVGRHLIGYTAAGPDEATVAAAGDATVAAPPPDRRGAMQVGASMIALGALLLVAGLGLAVSVVGIVGAFVAVIGGAIVGNVYVRRRDAQDKARQKATEWARSEHRIAEIGTALGELWAEAGRAATEAAAARARFEAQLAAEAPAASPLSAR
jgi:hypothetical protein